MYTEIDFDGKTYFLKETCGACPEQYDVFLEDENFEKKQVAYLRLRYGRFRADVPDCGGETVYSANPDGDGMFEDYERKYYLTKAIIAVDSYLEEQQYGTN